MTRIENHKYTVAEAFQECFYVVPDYQREYVWTDKEVHQLLEDIDEQIDAGSDQEYFVGMILVSPGTQKNHFEVIDGQQRLTTFYLLMCALRHRFKGTPQHQAINGLISASYSTKEGDIKTSLKLEPRYENADELMQCLVAQDDDPANVRIAVQKSGIAQFGSLENLLNAYSTIYHYLLDNYEDESSLKKLWGYLANNVVFIQISTDVSSALKIFETINERGVGLNPMDLLKNLLFTQVDQKNFTKLKNEWKKITAPLEKAKEKPLRFLRYYLMANYKITNKDSIIREDEIYNWFVTKDNSKLCEYKEKPFEFIRKIIRNVESYLAFSRGQGNDGLANIPMANLKKMCGGAFSQHYVLLLALANVPKPLFDHFIVQLESFLFYYIYTKTPTRELEKSFSQWADELREISELKDIATQKQKLNEFIDNRFHASMADKSDELSDALKRYTIQSMQQYRTRYLLAKLTQFVDMAYKGVTTPGSLDEYMPLEMEHILPNTPEPELRQSFTLGNPGANYDDYKNRLGNFTLLEKPINIVASNGFFEAKKAEYLKCKHYLTSSIAELTIVGKNSSINRINEKLKAFEIWTAENIDDRQAMLIGLAKEVWKTSGIVKTVLDNSHPPSTEPSATFSVKDDDEDASQADLTKPGLDFTKYDVTINGIKHEHLSKRKTMLSIVKHLCDVGVSPDEIAEEVPWREMFCSVNGTVSSEQFIEQQSAKVGPSGKHMYFCEDSELIHCSNKTYALSNIWGKRSFEAIQNILFKFPGNGIKCEEHDSESLSAGTQTTSKHILSTKWSHDTVFVALVKRKERVKTSSNDRYVVLYPQTQNCAILYEKDSQSFGNKPLHLRPECADWKPDVFENMRDAIRIVKQYRSFDFYIVEDWDAFAKAVGLED